MAASLLEHREGGGLSKESRRPHDGVERSPEMPDARINRLELQLSITFLPSEGITSHDQRVTTGFGKRRIATENELIQTKHLDQSLCANNQMVKRIRLKQIVEIVVRHQILGHRSTGKLSKTP